ncbi:hypothetical protein Y032_0021g388 [Ancylostoma ceylanicum]|uniref:Methylmalonic aciduria and homocystinuria type D protein, mitochondrial n=1 Tax=Ancylostoma ceylanicum TaxID=53326 RepID=A0A016V1V9_9BILA|nr:hypothetical protein Y032_0021g388 [Ancylostoma ceylanicum]
MKVTAVGPQMRAFTVRVRQFSAQPQFTHPSVVFVKEAAARQNSLLGPADKQFPLPGDVCHKVLLQEQPIVPRSVAPSVMDKNTHSVQEVLSSNRVDVDPNYAAQVQESVLEEAQANAGDWPVELTVQECPRLLKKDMKLLFPGMNFDNVNVSVMNITQKTENDMKAWSEEMEQEREMLTAAFISSATAIATTLRRCGYWADFIDPSSGRPYLGKFTNHTLFETDDAYKQMGFRIEDLGCCKVRHFFGLLHILSKNSQQAVVSLISDVDGAFNSGLQTDVDKGRHRGAAFLGRDRRAVHAGSGCLLLPAAENSRATPQQTTRASVLQHVIWATNAFVGTLFTDAPADSQIVQDIVRKVNTDDVVVQHRE